MPKPLPKVPRYRADLDRPKIYRCKHCKVQVVSASDWHPIIGKEHTTKCPRRYRYR